MNRLVTPKQLTFIHNLLDQVGPETRQTAKAWLDANYTSQREQAYGHGNKLGDLLPRDKASEVIERLLAAKANKAHEEAEERAEQELNDSREMQAREAAEEERRMEHKLAQQAEAEAAELPRYISTDEYPDVPAGRYAVDNADGRLGFYHVQHGKRKWTGKVFVKHHVAGQEDQRMSAAAGRTILARIQADGPEAASARYGHELGHCGLCGRELTNEDSRARGIGPVCADKAGW